MAYLKPELIAGEAVIKEYGCTVYMVRNGLSSAGSNVRLWLTDRRLILKAGFGPQRTLALRAILNVGQEKVGFHTMARIAFADGHTEWFTVENQAQFLQALETARAQAPEVPAEAISAPPPAPGALPAGSKRWLVIVGIFVAVVVICLCILAVGLVAYYYLLSSH